jgi:hypothetical protein
MWAEKGTLCGSGDMSIMSTQPGEDAGRGGVVMKPADASRQPQQAKGSSSSTLGAQLTTTIQCIHHGGSCEQRTARRREHWAAIGVRPYV